MIVLVYSFFYSYSAHRREKDIWCRRGGGNRSQERGLRGDRTPHTAHRNAVNLAPHI